LTNDADCCMRIFARERERERIYGGKSEKMKTAAN
jgi:hypothetical protein